MAGHDLAVSIPIDDGAIQRAFEVLDAQMNAWTDALHRIEHALHRGSSAEAALPALVVPAAAVATDPNTSPFIEVAPAVPIPSIESPPTRVASPVDAAVPVEPPMVESAPPVPSEPPAVSEDDTLLASLDAETAKSIRVMKRLCMGRKSVRELLAELQGRPNGQSAAVTGKKSWWRRDK